ncbi:hypothetical protein QOK74_07620 [Staphylococcus saprophyticus]|uniref:hypothetical protein n=1 Tax=Staphylococcus saprophyticus TaxID=29385 RepID=UPI0024C32356|nr:hypothetical protein [Staphylococcus saprophyticus]MDK1672745.1 hypothetical protein [Staphylococcus saprophyticus]
MKIRDLDLDQYVIVYDMGKSENNKGMTVVGRVEEIVFNDDNDNVATINSLGNLYDITDDNYFDLWTKSIEDKTEHIAFDKENTEKQLNLPQLIEWGFENEIVNKEYVCNEHKAKSVIFNLMGWAEFSDEFSYNPDDTFTVEVEEVVDEDTQLPKSLAIFEHNGNLYSEMHENKNINDILKMDIKVKSSSTKTIHMVNDDLTMTLIWKNGKLVE